MFSANNYSDEILEQSIKEIKEHRRWYIFEGLAFIAVGFLAFLMPTVTAIAVEVFLGLFFIFSGITRLGYGVFKERHRWWRIFSGALYTVAGVSIFVWPFVSLAIMLSMVGVLLLLEGVYEIALALALRPSKRWGWLLAAGITSIILGVLVFAGFPATGVLYVAIAIGISFLLFGISILAIALSSEKLKEPTA